MGEFTGQVALVTGSMSGMGEAIAARLAAEGATVVLNSRTTPETPVRFNGSDEDAMHVACDVSDEAAVIKMIAAIEARYGALDILVNNAGTTVMVPHDDLQGATSEIWNRILGVNIIGPWNTIKAAEKLLRASKNGNVVNISSIGGFRPALGSSVPYSVSKAGLNHLTQLLARSLGPDIRVNAIAPGFIETPWTSGEKWADRQRHVQEKAPLRRTGTAEDIAEACLGLIRSEYVTGAVLSVDGGLSLL
jgi:ketoreductase RED2